jgi:hypothetical protein
MSPRDPFKPSPFEDPTLHGYALFGLSVLALIADVMAGQAFAPVYLFCVLAAALGARS